MSENTIEAIVARLEKLEQRAHRAESHLAVCNLQASYGSYVCKTLYDEASDLFAKDATLQIAGRGLFVGQDRIREYLNALPKLEYGTLFNHIMIQPMITISDDGLSAKGRWHVSIQIGWVGKEARWGDGIYENEYVFEDGVWKISKLHFYTTYYIEFDQGWNKGGIPLAKPLDGVVPDEELTVEYKAFPDVYIPPFHYPNPVSKKPYS